MSSTEPENNINNGNNVGDALRLLEISRDNMTSGAASLQTSSTEYYSTHYKMNHSKCGIALILNHEFFTTPSLRTRTGTNVDCDSLINTLTSLNFEVKDMHNSIYSDIVRMLEKIANMDHSEHDCLIVAVLSHGILDYLYAYDTFYKAESLWCHFTPDKCPTLAGKPKLFFIQACQGKKLDPGIILLERTTTDGLPNATFQLQADFLIAYSTIPGYYSWRNTEHGSWFIEALCTELRENVIPMNSHKKEKSCLKSALEEEERRMLVRKEWYIQQQKERNHEARKLKMIEEYERRRAQTLKIYHKQRSLRRSKSHSPQRRTTDYILKASEE